MIRLGFWLTRSSNRLESSCRGLESLNQMIWLKRLLSLSWRIWRVLVRMSASSLSKLQNNSFLRKKATRLLLSVAHSHSFLVIVQRRLQQGVYWQVRSTCLPWRWLPSSVVDPFQKILVNLSLSDGGQLGSLIQVQSKAWVTEWVLFSISRTVTTRGSWTTMTTSRLKKV